MKNITFMYVFLMIIIVINVSYSKINVLSKVRWNFTMILMPMIKIMLKCFKLSNVSLIVIIMLINCVKFINVIINQMVDCLIIIQKFHHSTMSNHSSMYIPLSYLLFINCYYST